MHLCFVSRPRFLRTLRTSAHLGQNRCGTFIHHKINHSSNAPLTVPNASSNRSPTSAEVVVSLACIDHFAARFTAPPDALKRPSHDGAMQTTARTAGSLRGIAFGFASALRDQKSSKPDDEGDDRAKPFLLCSPSSRPDFQTR